MPRQLITQARLKELLSYNSDTGVFTWNIKRGRQKAGAVAGRCSAGYVQIQVDKCLYQAHWLAWFYVHNTWPTEEVDHINGDKKDNKIDNLRLASRSQQRQNHAKHRDNTSGFTGVSHAKKCPTGKPWWARIHVDKKLHSLGFYATAEEAHSAYLEAKKALHTFQPIPRQMGVTGQPILKCTDLLISE